MNRTKIEWTDFSWNPITGCKHGCWYCYAKKLAQRGFIKNDFKPTFYPERLKEPWDRKDSVISNYGESGVGDKTKETHHES